MCVPMLSVSVALLGFDVLCSALMCLRVLMFGVLCCRLACYKYEMPAIL